MANFSGSPFKAAPTPQNPKAPEGASWKRLLPYRSLKGMVSLNRALAGLPLILKGSKRQSSA